MTFGPAWYADRASTTASCLQRVLQILPRLIAAGSASSKFTMASTGMELAVVSFSHLIIQLSIPCCKLLLPMPVASRRPPLEHFKAEPNKHAASHECGSPLGLLAGHFSSRSHLWGFLYRRFAILDSSRDQDKRGLPSSAFLSIQRSIPHDTHSQTHPGLWIQLPRAGTLAKIHR